MQSVVVGWLVNASLSAIAFTSAACTRGGGICHAIAVREVCLILEFALIEAKSEADAAGNGALGS